jgi:hypothetical protein
MVGGVIIGENRLVVMAGAEWVDRYQIHQTQCFQKPGHEVEGIVRRA